MSEFLVLPLKPQENQHFFLHGNQHLRELESRNGVSFARAFGFFLCSPLLNKYAFEHLLVLGIQE